MSGTSLTLGTKIVKYKIIKNIPRILTFHVKSRKIDYLWDSVQSGYIKSDTFVHCTVQCTCILEAADVHRSIIGILLSVHLEFSKHNLLLGFLTFWTISSKFKFLGTKMSTKNSSQGQIFSAWNWSWWTFNDLKLYTDT